MAKLQANPEGNYVLRNEGEIVGHISFYPVESTTLREAITGERHGIPVDKILLFEPENLLDVLIFIISVKTGFPPERSKSLWTETDSRDCTCSQTARRARS